MVSEPVAQIVLKDPVFLQIILSYLPFQDLQECKGVSRRWRFEAIKILRPRTRVCVNPENVDLMLYSSSILGVELHVRWPTTVSQPLQTLLEKYSRYITALSWFIDDEGSGSAGRGQGQRAAQQSILPVNQFPGVTHLYFLLTANKAQEHNSFALFASCIRKCHQLESIRVNIPHYNSCVNSITPQKLLRCITDTRLAGLKTLHFGSDLVHVPSEEFPILGQLQPKLRTLICEGEGVGPTPVSFQDEFMNYLEILQLPTMQSYEIPRKTFYIKSLSITNINFPVTMYLADQFPVLEDLSFSFPTTFAWEAWIPPQSNPLQNLKSLQWLWLFKNPLHEPGRNCILRLLTLSPRLQSLHCPVYDNFLQQICAVKPTLKKLGLLGSCTDTGLTGIDRAVYPVLRNRLINKQMARTPAELQRFRTSSSVCDLNGLEEITIAYTSITDLAINFGLSMMSSLRRVYVTGVSVSALTDLLVRNPQIRVLGVPQPKYGKIDSTKILELRVKFPAVKILIGWDVDFIPPKKFLAGGQ